MKPLANRVLIDIQEPPKQTTGGIFIPDTVNEKPDQGIVLSVGPEVRAVQAGNRVLFSKYGGSNLQYSGKTVKILSEKDILAILED
jgi:chaperonin GroES